VLRRALGAGLGSDLGRAEMERLGFTNQGIWKMS
jgi:hypothetical protein